VVPAATAANLLPTGVAYAERTDLFGVDAPTWGTGDGR
jgi:hypothetical protein